MTVNGATIDPSMLASLTAQNTSTTPSTGKSGLGQDAFLNLLVTQLKHQDPLQPKEDGEFLAQLAQFSSLEQLTSIKDSIRELADLMKAAMDGTSTDSSPEELSTDAVRPAGTTSTTGTSS